MVFKCFKLFFVFVFLIFLNLKSFNTISDLHKYCKMYPEFPESDNQDLDKLSFLGFYKKIRIGYWDKFLMKIGLKEKQAWQPNIFFEELKKINESVSKIKTPKLGKLIEVSPDSKIVIFGDIYGSLHSLARDLESLKYKKIIDDKFKIIDDNTYIMFTGNVVNFSSYSLETLTVIFKILQANPDKAFYIKGEYEDNKIWNSAAFNDELSIRFPELLNYKTKIIEYAQTFFESLPMVIFVNLKDTEDLIAVSYYGPPEDPFYDLLCDVKNLPDKIKKIACDTQKSKLSIKAYIKGNDPMTFTGLTKYSIDKTKTYKFGQGLYRTPDIDGVTSWTIVSSPIILYMIKYEFYYDSYSIVDIKNPIEKSTISNFYNDARTPLDLFRTGFKYNLISGNLIKQGMFEEIRPQMSQFYLDGLSYDQYLKTLEFIEKRLKILSDEFENLKKMALKNNKIKEFDIDLKPEDLLPDNFNLNDLKSTYVSILEIYNGLIANFNSLKRSFDKFKLSNGSFVLEKINIKNNIVLGSSCDLSRLNKSIGIPMISGMSLKISSLNKEGGLNGKFITPIFLDDFSLNRLMRINFQTLIDEYNCETILFCQGSRTLESCLDIIKEKKVYVFFPQSSSLLFRDSNLKTLVNYRASLLDQIKVLTNYILNNYKSKKILFFYSNQESNKEILSQAREILKKNNILDWSEIPYDEAATSFEHEAKKIKDINPNCIAFIGNAFAVSKLVDEIGIDFFVKKILYGTSNLSDEATLKYFKDKGLKIILPQVVPNPLSSNLEIVQDYRNDLIKNNLTPNIFSLEGYIVTSILFDQILKIKGSITAQSIMDQIETIKDYNFKGLNLTFDTNNRTIGKTLWIDDPDLSKDWIQVDLA